MPADTRVDKRAWQRSAVTSIVQIEPQLHESQRASVCRTGASWGQWLERAQDTPTLRTLARLCVSTYLAALKIAMP